MSAAGFAAPNSPMTNNELTANRAQDSTSIVIMALYNPPIPPGVPRTARTALQCKTSRMTIMRVRRMLSETEIEKYGSPRLVTVGTRVANPKDW